MEERFLTIVDIFKIIKSRWRQIFITVFLVGVISAGISLLLPKWYKASAVILIPESTAPGISSVIAGNLGIPQMFPGGGDLNKYIAILKSRSLISRVVDRFHLQEKYGKESYEETLNEFKNNLDVVIGEELQIIVSVYDKDQDLVADITSYVVYCLDSINISLSVESARNNRLFIQSRLMEVMDSLKTLESEMVSYMKSKGILSLPDQLRVSVEKAADLKANLTYKEIQYEVERKTLGEKSPMVEQTLLELQSLRRKYEEFKSGVDELLPRFSEVPRMAVDLERIKRQIEYYSKLIEFLGPQYENAKIEEAKKIPTIQVLDHPVRPEKKARPHRMIIVLVSCFVAGMFITGYFIIKDMNSYS